MFSLKFDDKNNIINGFRKKANCYERTFLRGNTICYTIFLFEKLLHLFFLLFWSTNTSYMKYIICR